jgi:hypothetical protein
VGAAIVVPVPVDVMNHLVWMARVELSARKQGLPRFKSIPESALRLAVDTYEAALKIAECPAVTRAINDERLR